MRCSFTLPALALLATSLTACSRKQAPMADVPPVTIDTIAMPSDSMDMDAMRRDSLAREAAMRAERERQMAEARNTMMAAIYFNFDRSDLTAEARSTLDAKLPIMNANPGMRIRIVGNTDERGSDEYNMALGQRRAVAAKRYLTNHGVEESRIETVSFGEERPAAQGSGEMAWSQNRRDEFEITVAGEIATRP